MNIDNNEIVALIGANGAGKSTIIKTISGLVPVSSGSIIFEGKRIENMPAHKIITNGIALVPEGRRLFPYMTVQENLELGAYVENNREKVRENMEWVFGLFPILDERKAQLAGTFSGGEQQMLTIGRALMSKPKFLMMDEPSLGLSPLIVDEVFKTVELLQNEGVTILLVEQNVRKSLEIANRGYVLEHGRIVLSGEATGLLEDENVKKAYLGM
ncbi:MAG: ABC transporter ATP-binding protein [Deltaproteobacteria bacterium]|nr:MAG: ABC transporter ATP-binding protein [Deltaproteobacteria bacterium]